MPDNSRYLAFVNDPDQPSRELELAAFLGPKAESFLPAYRVMLPGPDGKVKSRVFGGGFSVGAFFTGPVWFFYRKLWVAGWTITGLLVFYVLIGFVIPHLPNSIGISFSLIIGFMANRIAVTHAIQRIQALRGPDGTTELAVLAAEGGVSRRAAWIAGSIYAIVTAFGLLSMIYLIMHGIPPE